MAFGLFSSAAEAKSAHDEGYSTPYVPPKGSNIVSLMERRPKPVAVDLPELTDLSEYEAVAAVLGFSPPEIAKRKLEVARREVIEFLLDKGYPIYDNAAVHAFMSELAERDDKVFCWARLRGETKDESQARFDEIRREILQQMPFSGLGRQHVVSRKEHGLLVSSSYQKAVPLEMLKRAASIKERFGAEVEFYVSDFAVVDPDPFIMVKRGECEHIVFGVWDEPSFGLK